jgi:hypothetical protein
MSETAQAFNWTVTAMQADSALMAAAIGGVWQDYAPIGTAPPFVIVSQQVSNDVLTVNAVRLFTNKLMQIKAIGPAANFAALVTIADRIDALFKSVRDVGLGVGGVLSCYREQEISYSELINGAQWSHLGGLYAINLQGA